MTRLIKLHDSGTGNGPLGPGTCPGEENAGFGALSLAETCMTKQAVRFLVPRDDSRCSENFTIVSVIAGKTQIQSWPPETETSLCYQSGRNLEKEGNFLTSDGRKGVIERWCNY